MSEVLTQTSRRYKKQQPRIAFSIPLPYDGKQLQVIYSANAWWMDKSKIHALENAFKINATIHEACAYAGITLRQYKYFVSLHPEFNEARELYKCRLILRAKFNIAKALESSDQKLCVKTSIWFLERYEEEWAKPKRRKNQGLVRWEQDQRALNESNLLEEAEDVKKWRETKEKIYARIKVDEERKRRGLPPLPEENPIEKVEWNPEDEGADNYSFNPESWERSRARYLKPQLPELQKHEPPPDPRLEKYLKMGYSDPEFEEKFDKFKKQCPSLSPEQYEQKRKELLREHFAELKKEEAKDLWAK